MRRARLAALLLCVALGAALLPVVPAGAAPPAAPACDPVLTPPELAGQVPTAEEVIGFPLGERDVTVAESDAYLQAVADASPRVTAGTAAVSWQGRPLNEKYPIVYLDALYVKMRDGAHVQNRAVHLAIGVTMEGRTVKKLMRPCSSIEASRPTYADRGSARQRFAANFPLGTESHFPSPDADARHDNAPETVQAHA